MWAYMKGEQMPIRATNSHPLVQKLERIFQKMEDEGVKIIWEDRCFIVTGEDGKPWEIRELEDTGYFQLGPTVLPPFLEYKLVRDEE
jgi:hypothetical protein